MDEASLKRLSDKQLWELLEAIRDDGYRRGWGSFWEECRSFNESESDPEKHVP